MTVPTQPGHSWSIDADSIGVRLDSYLARPDRIGSRQRASRALSRGQVFLNEREAGPSDAAYKLAARDVVRVWMDRPGSSARRSFRQSAGPLDVLYEDASLLIVNKPAGLLSVPLGNQRGEKAGIDFLKERLRGRLQLHVVHRIDRDTSGLMVVARTPSASGALKEQFERHEAERVYLAVVHGVPEPSTGTWRDRVAWDSHALRQRLAPDRNPHGRDAISHYRVVERFASAALLEVRLVTGKRNQIRLQASVRGYPLVGERQYTNDDLADPIAFPRQALHAWKLGLRHPVDGRILRFEAPMPADFRKLLRRLRARQ